MDNFLVVFIGLSVVNVVFSTIRSIVTINGGKVVASLFSGGYFAFYNIMMQYTVADFPMWQKCVITFVCNVVGVYLVKLGEEKSRKDRPWKVEATFPHTENLLEDLKVWKEETGIETKYFDITKWYEINFYSSSKRESLLIKQFVKKHNGKYFVTESKNL